MGAQWKHRGRVENATKRGALISKLTKEIIVAAKTGDPSPENNHRLRAAVEAAKKASVPRDTIDRAIKKGAGLLDETVHFELVTYEGFAPHKIPVIVECLTDNKNRTAADIRAIFRKGQLGSMGSVTWMFDRWGIVEATHPHKKQDLETIAIEAGAQNVESLDPADVPQGELGARFLCNTSDLDTVAKFLSSQSWTITTSELSYIAKSYPELSENQKKEVTEFLTSLDENDDVHRIYAAFK